MHHPHRRGWRSQQLNRGLRSHYRAFIGGGGRARERLHSVPAINQVFKVNSVGNLNVVAGYGTAAYGGDDGSATTATLNGPGGVAVDSSGNFIIADTQNQSIRRVDAATGIITAVAGDDLSGYSGDGGPATTTLACTPSVAVDSRGNVFSYGSKDDAVVAAEGTSTGGWSATKAQSPSSP